MAIRWASVALALAAALAAQAGEEPTPSTLEKIMPTKLRIQQHGCGALLREDFNKKSWGADWWPWIQDEALKVECKGGQLRISGVSGKPVPVCAAHHEFRFTGLVSRNFPQRDVVMACRMRVLAPLPQDARRARYLTHLCGATPDYFVDFGLSHEPDGRQGWFYVPIADGYPFSHDFQAPFLSLEEIRPDQEHTFVIEHEAPSKLTRGFVVDGDLWRSLGEHRLFMSTTQVELKVDVPYDGVPVDVAYDDARLYLRPETAPARFVLLKPPFPYFPFPSAVVEFKDDADRPVATAQTDANGEATIPLPGRRLYPMGGTVKVAFGGKDLGVATIEARGVEGLYPGDVWVIFAPDEYKVADRGYPMGM